MIAYDNVASESLLGWAAFLMPREKKINKSYRLRPLAASLIDAEIADRKERLGADTKVTEADVVEEAIYRYAAANPRSRERIIGELRKDPRFAAIADSMAPKTTDTVPSSKTAVDAAASELLERGVASVKSSSPSGVKVVPAKRVRQR